MSSTWIAEFKDEKDYLHFVNHFKKLAPEGGCVVVPETPYNPENVRCRGAYVDLEEVIYEDIDDDSLDEEPPIKENAKVISFDIAIWDNWTKDFIRCLMQEMCNRYEFIQIGCTSGDLCSPEKFIKTNIFEWERSGIQLWREGLIRHPIGTNHPRGLNIKEPLTEENVKSFEKQLSDIEGIFRGAAKRFFEGECSDLIIRFENEK